MLHTEKFGEAEKGHLVLVHGLGSHFRRQYRLIKRAKKRGFKLHTFDWPGHGESDGPRGHARMGETIEIINDIVENTDERPFLFGHSLGGLTVIRYAQEYPGAVEGVISSSPALKSSESMFMEKFVSFFAKLFPKKTISNSIDVEEVTRSEEERKNYSQDEYVHEQISLALASDLFNNIDKAHEKNERFSAPLLLLTGTADKITPIEGAETFFKSLDMEDKEFKKFAGSYHEIFNDPEWKEEYHEKILNWLEDHS